MSFGTVACDAGGIAVGKKRLPWREVDVLERAGDKLEVKQAGKKKKTWAKCGLNEIVNLQTEIEQTLGQVRKLEDRMAFAEVTIPLVWTGLFGAFLFGFTLTWNDFDRTVLLVIGDPTLPLEIVGLIQNSALRPDLYALGTATTLVSLGLIALLLIVVAVRSRFRKPPVQRVEEELGLVGGIDAEAAETVVQA